MKHRTSPFVALVVVVALAGCAGGVGGLGPINPASQSAEPSLPLASPDATPGGAATPAPGASASAPTPSAPAPSAGATAAPSAGATASPSGGPAPTATPSSPSSGETMVVRVYFWLAGDEISGGLAPVLREVPRSQAPARAAMEQLLGGPSGREVMDGAGIDTAVPAGTRLLGLSIGDGTAIVDLSREFEASAGSASSFINLAQVVYTLTQFPTVERVQFRIEGEDVTVFGSEGIVIDRPQTRADFEDQLPAIFVDRPAWGASLLNPARIAGNANVFEATLNVLVRDGDGIVIADQVVTATCGTGCRGTFDVTLQYDVDEPQWGELETNFFSAQDGSVQGSRAYPVWLTPAG